MARAVHEEAAGHEKLRFAEGAIFEDLAGQGGVGHQTGAKVIMGAFDSVGARVGAGGVHPAAGGADAHQTVVGGIRAVTEDLAGGELRRELWAVFLAGGGGVGGGQHSRGEKPRRQVADRGAG